LPSAALLSDIVTIVVNVVATVVVGVGVDVGVGVGASAASCAFPVCGRLPGLVGHGSMHSLRIWLAISLHRYRASEASCRVCESVAIYSYNQTITSQ